MMPSGHKAFLVSNVKELELLLMMNKTYAAEYVQLESGHDWTSWPALLQQDCAQRLLTKENRHHCTREAAGSKGYKPEGEGHNGGLSQGRAGGAVPFLVDLTSASNTVWGVALLRQQ
jgi:hypothetical protein